MCDGFLYTVFSSLLSSRLTKQSRNAILSEVKMFMKVVDLVFLYGSKGVVNVA